MTLQTKIDILRNFLDKSIEMNNYVISDDIVKLSQMVDEFIVKYERIRQAMDSSKLQGV